MIENWLALYLAIFKNINANDAIKYMKYGRESVHFKRHIYTDRKYIKDKKERIQRNKPFKVYNEAQRKERFEVILKLREENKTWKQIGEILNITPEAAFSRFTRFKKSKEKEAIANAPTTTAKAISLNNNSLTL